MSQLVLALCSIYMSSQPADPENLGGMATPGWQQTSQAEIAEFGSAVQGVRQRLRDRLAQQQEVSVERDVVYATRGEDKLLVDVYQPAGEGPHAAVLVVHGGAWRSGNKNQLLPYARQLAARGHVAFAINYRLAPDHIFPAQIEDCREAVRFIHNNAEKYKVDKDRLGAIGYSAGGHLVALLGAQGVKLEGEIGDAGDDSQNGAATNGDMPMTDGAQDAELIRLKAVAPGGAPCDFRGMPARNRGLAFWLGGSPGEKPANYRDASPAEFVSQDACPMFFFHGENDELVNLASPQAMMKSLAAEGVECSLHVVEGGSHIAAAMDQPALEAALDFLDMHLKNEDGPASDRGDGQ